LLAATRPDPDELGGIVLDRDILERLLDRERLADDAKRGAVFRRHIGDVICGAQRSGARHVLRNDDGMAWQMAAEMAGDEPAHQVVRAARRIADVDGEGLAGKVSVLSACRCCGRDCEDREGGRESDCESGRHTGPLGGAIIRSPR